MSRVEKKHILLEKAITYKVTGIRQDPEGFHYNLKLGAWLDNESKQFYSLSYGRRPPQTKKEDIETGEDQKGE